MKFFFKKLILLFAVAASVLPACSKKPDSATPPAVGTGQTVKDADGNGYDTVIIGTQVWLVQNLKTTHYRDGSPIANATDSATWVNNTTGAYCDYNNTPSNSAVYGRLYNWFAAGNSRNICPKGWHIPSYAEWVTLATYLGDTVAGAKLKEAGTAHWTSPNKGATNVSGFTALPGGDRQYNALFYNIGNDGVLWSSTLDSNAIGNVFGLYLNSFNNLLSAGSASKPNGFSVRCVRD
jgi:uncharacterized protein (TIGR02145 family)